MGVPLIQSFQVRHGIATPPLCHRHFNGRTPALEGLLADPKNYGSDTVQEMLKQIPCGGRLVEPEEIGYAVAMLCADKARFTNGVHVHVNGGIFID